MDDPVTGRQSVLVPYEAPQVVAPSATVNYRDMHCVRLVIRLVTLNKMNFGLEYIYKIFEI